MRPNESTGTHWEFMKNETKWKYRYSSWVHEKWDQRKDRYSSWVHEKWDQMKVQVLFMSSWKMRPNESAGNHEFMKNETKEKTGTHHEFMKNETKWKYRYSSWVHEKWDQRKDMYSPWVHEKWDQMKVQVLIVSSWKMRPNESAGTHHMRADGRAGILQKQLMKQIQQMTNVLFSEKYLQLTSLQRNKNQSPMGHNAHLSELL